MASHDLECEAEFPLVVEQPRQSSGPWKKLALGVVAGLAVCGAVARWSYVEGVRASTNFESKVQVVAAPPATACSKTTDDCFDTGCCNVEGYTCFETSKKSAKKAMCMKKCDPKKFSCIQRTNTVLAEAKPVASTRMYCFAVVVVETGNPKPSHELELMNNQVEKNLGIFQCEENGIFSDGDIALSNGRKFWRVYETDGDWRFAKRKETNCWVNTGLFSDVWRQVAVEAKWQTTDWVVKVDPDAVFVPARLQQKLATTLEAEGGSYFVNCPYVDYGFFGNLELFSKQAWSVLLDNIDDCKADTDTINWKVGIKGGKYGPMGEDLFAQTCMDKHGVKRVNAFDMTQDGACEEKRDPELKKDKKFQPHCSWAYGASIHPFKKVDQWNKCYDETMKAYPKPL